MDKISLLIVLTHTEPFWLSIYIVRLARQAKSLIVYGVIHVVQVYVGKHIPPHPAEIPLYMQEFGNWLNSEKPKKMHPVEFAAVAHYKLVYIHPFIDGNGRTSRLLMNMILMKNGFPPVSIQVSVTVQQSYFDY